MIVPFWSWNLSDTTHVRPHTKFQLVWAIITVFTRGGAQCVPPLTQMCSRDPLNIRVKISVFCILYPDFVDSDDECVPQVPPAVLRAHRHDHDHLLVLLPSALHLVSG